MKYDRLVKLKSNSPVITIFTVLFQSFFTAIVMLEISVVVDNKAIKMFTPFAAIIIFILTILVIVSITQVIDYAKKGEQARILKSHLRTVDELMTTLQAERHEYTRHVQTVQAMLFLGETEKACDYMDGVARRYWNDEGIAYVGEPLLTGLINSKKSMASSVGIDFGFAFKCDPRRLPIEPWDLCSLIGNLLDNAFEAAILEEHGRHSVGIELKDEQNYYVIYVYNTGPKIDNPEKLFLPGYTSKGSHGRGYGLYIVKQIVEGCGGSIEVFSTPKTTFVVSLPKGENDCDKNDEFKYRGNDREAISL